MAFTVGKDGTWQVSADTLFGFILLEGADMSLVLTHFGGLVEKHERCAADWILLVVEFTKEYVFSNNLYYWLGERHEDVVESINDQWQVKEEIHGETLEAPTTDDLLRELENEMPEAYETPASVQKGIWMTKHI